VRFPTIVGYGRDRRPTLRQALTDQREVGLALLVERDQLAVGHRSHRQLREKAGAIARVQPRRLRTRNGPSVETIARKPSHFSS
jgi:hypothetical protein